jgi:hypothetical protein
MTISLDKDKERRLKYITSNKMLGIKLIVIYKQIQVFQKYLGRNYFRNFFD